MIDPFVLVDVLRDLGVGDLPGSPAIDRWARAVRAAGKDPVAAAVEEGWLTAEEARDARERLEERADAATTAPAPDAATVAAARDPDHTPSVGATIDAEPAVDLGRGTPEPVPAAGPRFREVRDLGEGGMGSVVLAIDRDLRREVAIKRLRDPERRDRRLRFVEEAQVTGQLQHPNIVPVHELGLETESRSPFLVMKRVRGRTLADVLEAVGNGDRTGLGPGDGEADPGRTLSRLLEVIRKVSDAIGYAHSRGVVHRDLKPANVMVGEFGEVQVMDWGLAKVVDHPDGQADRLVTVDGDDDPDRATPDGGVVGTLFYMSPEQADGRIDQLGPATDVYALGALLYQVLALVPPFENRGFYPTLRDVTEGKLVPPSERSEAPWSVPGELEAVVLRAMAHDPADRYDSVADLRADLDAWLEGRTLAAADYAPWEVAAKWAARHRTAVAGGVATLLALLIGAVALLVGVRQARIAEETRIRSGRVAEAEALYAPDAWERAAAEVPFDRASPQTFFQSRLEALQPMGRALRRHPDPPDRWREDVARHARVLQERAQEVGDWALARVMALSAESWGAIDAGELDARLEAVETAAEEALEADVARLDEALRRIERATRPVDEEQGFREGAARERRTLVPGELEERARQLARRGGAGLTAEILHRLEHPGEDGAPSMGSPGRRFLVELLGRRGDARTPARRQDHVGCTAPELVAEALSGVADPGRGNEQAAWIRAAAWLEALSPGCLAEHHAGGLDGLLGQVVASAPEASPVRPAAREARFFLQLVASLRSGGETFLPSRASAPESFRRLSREMADWLAGRAVSGASYVEAIVRRLDEARDSASLPSTEFLLDQLGRAVPRFPSAGDTAGRGAVERLRGIYSALPDDWRRDERPVGVDAGTWERRRVLAVAAARNLARTGDPELLRVLHDDRHDLPASAWFHRRTALPLVIAPISGWPEPGGVAELEERAHVRRLRRNLEGALVDYREALRLRPDLARLHVKRAVVLRSIGDLDEAEAAVSAALEADPDLARARAVRGGLRQMRGDPDGALAAYDEALRLDPDRARWHLARGVVRQELGDLDEATADYTEALRLEPDLAAALVNRGQVLQARGEAEEAIADYTRALRLEPGLVGAYIDRATARVDAGDLEGALEDLTVAIRLHPGEPHAHLNRGLVRQRLGDLEGAQTDYSEAIRLAPDFVEARRKRASVRIDLGDYRGTIEDCTVALRRDPDLAWALYARGVARRALGRPGAALDDLDRVLERNPDHVDARVTRAQACIALGRLEEAEADLKRVLRRDPDHITGLVARAHLRNRAGDVAGARDDLDHALRVDPGNAGALYHRSLLRRSTGDPEGALADLDRAIEAAPNFRPALVQRGQARNARGDLEGALEDFEAAVRLRPEASIWVNVGILRVELGDEGGARRAFAEALERCSPERRPRYESIRDRVLGE